MKHSLFTYIKILAAVGVALSLYLLWQQLFRPAFQPCTINSYINCDAIISGPVAKTLGLPTPLYGLIGYLLILYGAITHKAKLILSMAAFGLVFCLWIAYQELFLLHVICPVCILCQVVMISVFICSLLVSRRKIE